MQPAEAQAVQTFGVGVVFQKYPATQALQASLAEVLQLAFTWHATVPTAPFQK